MSSARAVLLLCGTLVACGHESPAPATPPLPSASPLPADEAADEPTSDAVAGAPAGDRLVAGADHACAIESERVFCWGSPERRALGEDVLLTRWAEPGPPLWVRDVDSPVELAAGQSFTCALASTGAVVCWGDIPRVGHWTEEVARTRELMERVRSGGFEELREHAERTRRVPIEGWRDVVDLDATAGRICAVHREGTVSCRGFDGARPPYRPRLDAEGRIEGMPDARSVAVGIGHVCVSTRSGRVRCAGTFGLVDDEPDEPPATTEVPGLTEITQVASGAVFACALSRSGRVSCWGEVMPGDATSRTARPVIIEGAGPARSIAVGDEHACALRTDGRVRCWGRGFYGELGDGETVDRPRAVEVVGIDDAVELAAGRAFSCARRTAGEISCWGRNHLGQLGTREPLPSAFLTTVEGVSDAIDVDVGASHACAVRSDGRVACWGNDNHGQLGDGGGGPWRRRAPSWIDGLDGVVDVTLGRLSSCARTADGAMHYCWGQWGGRGGTTAGTDRSDRPVRVESSAGLGRIALRSEDGCAGRQNQPRGHAELVERTCGETLACGVTRGRALSCWDDEGSAVPGLELRDVAAVECSGYSCCAIASGSLHCWGALGGVPTDPLSAAEVPVALAARDPVAFGVSDDFVCWAERQGAVRCWGTDNAMGQLGAATADFRPQPVHVAPPVTLDEEDARARLRRAIRGGP